MLKFTDEKKEWENEKFLLTENVKVLKQKYEELEKEMEEKGKEPKVKIIAPTAQTNEESIVQSMSQVSLRYLEMVGLKNQNKNLENAA